VTVTFEEGGTAPAVVWAITGDGMSLVGECATRSGGTVLVETIVDDGPLTLMARVHRAPGATFLRFLPVTRATQDYRRLLRAVGLADPSPVIGHPAVRAEPAA
jgi:hypothetical protein